MNCAHAMFLDLDISIINDRFVFKFHDNRENNTFFIVRMPEMSNSIPSYFFYDSVGSDFQRRARSTLLFEVHFKDRSTVSKNV